MVVSIFFLEKGESYHLPMSLLMHGERKRSRLSKRECAF